jgi:iron complex outermembrane receptor protein
MRGIWFTDASHAAFAVLATLSLAIPSHAQDERRRFPEVLEEIMVTATRVETNLQETPMSVKAFTSEQLDLAGIDAGRDLGIMVPNAVMNPGAFGERAGAFTIRGLPGVTTYVDGVWVNNLGFLQRSFVELERVEVLRGPQGTLFGRNSNGGAVEIITRRPAEEFGARFDVELAEYQRRTVKAAVDVPVGEQVQTKWTAAKDQSDGFMPSRSAPFSGGDQDSLLLRGDVVWAPSDRFRLRFNLNKEDRESTPARIVRITNLQNPNYIAYNVLSGNPDYLAQARAVNPSFPDPPFELPADRFTAVTHQAGYPGGELGRWETRLDLRAPTVIDQIYGILTLSSQMTDRFSLESLTSNVQADSYALNTYSASEFDDLIEMVREEAEWHTQELRIIGNHFDGRLQSLMGLYYQDLEVWGRTSGWSHWEFAIPNTGPAPPAVNLAARNYVRAWGATVGNSAVAGFVPLTFGSYDNLTRVEDIDRAIFGQLKIGLLEQLDLTIGLRVTGDDGALTQYVPGDAFRPPEPGSLPPGEPYAVAGVLSDNHRPDFGSTTTPKVSIAYRPTDDVYVYVGYAEGFTSSALINDPVVGPYLLDPEVVRTRELGLRSDWLESRLRLNATYFDSRWQGLRVVKFIEIENQPLPRGVLTDDGTAHTTGVEIELHYMAGERWQVDFGLGLLDSEYVEIGDPPANGSGLQPGIPLAYAPETSYTVGLHYSLPLADGGRFRFAGNYGWMDEYMRFARNEFQNKNPDGTPKLEPGYGVLNARLVYEPSNEAWQLAVFGTNLTNEWYVNGGFDHSLFLGYDIGQIGRPREVGIGLRFTFD